LQSAVSHPRDKLTSESTPLISIIIPALNEAMQIGSTLAAMRALRGDKEIIVADGGSDDSTCDVAQSAGVIVVDTPRGRGRQMHAAVTASRGEILWFVHADTLPPQNALEAIEAVLADTRNAAGNFALEFSGSTRAARQMSWIYPRLRRLGLSYGDASIFVRREVYEQSGGFRPYPIFEDLDLIRRLKRAGRFIHLDCPIVTSSRRFEGRYLRSWAIWITLQVLYWIGVSPSFLARHYRHIR